ncbi:hypothetical protein Goarm_004778 [Gossypium armourianum]|uniref:3-ketoacyl-CoA synthase n=1 Tax=Gossypium armourianum TaxID=34283 RepID=A0A7J9JXU0_9ROSI|nr:hypothetical protein [Gossypium armourianum]
MARNEQDLLSPEIVNCGIKSSGPNSGSLTFSVRVQRRIPDFLYAEVESLSREELWKMLSEDACYDLATVLSFFTVFVFTISVYFMSGPRSIYLIDFACFRPQDDLKVTKEQFIEMARASGKFDEASLQFQKRIVKSSGVGDETYLPKAVISDENSATMKEGRLEASTVMFGALDELFEKTRIRPKDVGVLVVNCSIFNPTPSLSAMIINHYKMRGNVLSYNLGGMGCSAGLIAVDLARDMLQANPNNYAVVVNTEMVGYNWSIYQEEDGQGFKGLKVNKDLMGIGGDALKTNITTLGPLVLPFSEQLFFFATLIWRQLFGGDNSKASLSPSSKPYIPDYKLAFEHFCVHAASKTVLDELQKNLELTENNMEASRMTLHRFGDTSSSSIWYELAYLEAKERVKRGDKVWQITFGSGFKCNSVVWRCMHRVKKPSRDNPRLDCIDRYSVVP